MEVKYFDADKKLIDVVTQPLYGVVVPPSQEVAFRVRDAADKPKTSYVSNSVRVVSAEQRAPQRQQSSERAPQRQQSSQSSFSWSELLISSAPLLLLIGVMLFSIRSMNSPLIRNVELMEKQNALLERLAVAAEKLAPETRS
jgi:ATP-dependent Zn protease